MSKPQQLRFLENGKFALEPQTIDVQNPQLGDEEYLVKMEYAAINPSDFLYIHGKYAHAPPPQNQITGFEGSGEVVKAGGKADQSLVGKKVVVLSYAGVHQNYKVTKREGFFVLEDGLYTKEVQTHFFINPITVIGMLEYALNKKAKAIIQNGAAANTGRMFTSLCKRYGIPIVNIVRSAEHTPVMKKLGAAEVLVSTDADFKTKLAEAIKKYDITLAFDCVAGEDTGHLVNAMPAFGTVVNYGALSGKAISGLNPGAFIFNNVHLEGFHLMPTFLAHKNKGFAEHALNDYYKHPLQTDIEIEEIPLEKVEHALTEYANKKKKYIVKF